MSKLISLSAVRKGEQFIYDNVRFVKLDDYICSCFALTVDTLPDPCPFEQGSSERKDANNYNGSYLESVVDAWLKAHKTLDKAVVDQPIDLTSMDGMCDYGFPMVHGRVLTVDEYRLYREFIPLTDKPYWLATAWCTLRSANSNAYYAYYVYTDGSLDYHGVYSANYYCPRPALYLESSILVLVEDDGRDIQSFTDEELIAELYRRKQAEKDGEDK